MIKTFQKILDFKRNSVFKLSFKAVRQVNSKFLHPKENNPNNNVKEVSIPEKNLTKVSELNRVEKKKKVKEISTINKFELINKYKINLPLTSYSERLHHGNFEYKYIRKLTTEFYNDQLDLPRDKLWITLDCPPFANGPAHLGTMYNKVLKDITNRFKIIQGYKVNFINGFDCYGVEIEDSAMSMGKSDKIEEIYSKFNKLDQSRKDEDYNHKKMQLEEEKTLEIRKKCRSFVEASLIDHVKNYLRWGIMCNIGQTFLTMDKNYEANQLELFKLLYEKGLIYRDYRVVFWSINDKRIIDDNELGYRQEIKDVLIFKCEIKFFGGETKFLKEKFPEIKLLVYISQPWTYVGIKAIAINPEMNYLIVNMKDEYFICAEKRLPEIARRYNCEKPKKLYQFQGSALLDIIANEPIFNRDLQILADNGVSDKFGSGINALIPAHDFKSEKICAKNKITMRGYVDNQGKFTNDLGIYFKGVDCFTEGGNRIIKKLQKKNSLFLQWDYETTVFFNNKTQETLLLMSIPCFFMKISNKIKLDSLKELAFVKFAPELDFFEEKDETLKYQPQKRRRSLKEKESSTYDNVIEALNDFDDWCISEFNKWGLPIPYFVYIDNENKILLDGEVIDHIAKLIKEEGSDIWFEKSVKDLLPEKYKDQADKLQKGREMFDSFFDSSCSWYNLLIKNTLSLNSSQENSKGPLSDIIKDKFNTLVSDKVSESLLEFGSNGKKPHGMIEDKTRTGSITKNEHKHNNNNILEKRQQEHKAEFREQLNEFKIEGFLEGVKAIIPENILLKYGMEKFIKKNDENISYFPADICVEGNDQHKDWLLLSSLTSVALKNEIPFKRIKTHGLINDESGNKMSKTFVKSYLNPLDLTDGTKKLNGERMFGYGADNIRMWIIKNDCDSDIKITEKDIEIEKTKLKIFRHFSKFCLGTLSDYDPSFEQKIYTINFEDLEILEQILIHEYIKTLKVIDENLVNYNYRVIYEEIFKFISEKFIKIFMDSTQKLFLTLAKDSYERRSLQYFLKEIFINTLVVLSPIIPFTCEDVYENIDFMVKKPYLGFEEYKNHEYYIRRYSYKIDNNFEFNSSNLTDIKFEMNKIINKMVDMGLNKNEIEIYFETEDTSYEYLLLKSLNNKMSSFFSVAKCVFGVYSKNPEDKLSNRELKKGTIKFEKILNQKTLEKFEIYLNYKIFKTIKNKCIRCLLFKCEAQEVVCEECTKNMKLLI